MIKQSLQLKGSQQLAITPQLQQAIRLLQLSTTELCQEIDTALENNPLLEVEEYYDEVNVAPEIELENIDTREMMDNRDIPDDIPLDTSLHDMYSAGTPSGTSSDYRDEAHALYQGETHQTLNDYLMWQLQLTRFSDRDRVIATSIIQAINERGYLTTTLDDILEEQGNDEIELEEVEAVLKRIQHFDPIGIGARSLKECLLIQINQLSPMNLMIKNAKNIIENYLALLGQRDFKSLIKHMMINEESLKQSITLIQQLQPNPGESVNTVPPDYVIPDIFVKKVGGKWQVSMNNRSIPSLKINQHYALMEKNASESDSLYIRQARQDASWLIKSIANRNETLIKVSQFIVDHQNAFFEHGESQMKPMILSDVAAAIEMHESTISRVTTQKYLQCPRGVFELKYFFSANISTDSGEEASSIAIRALIKKIVASEDGNHPLSDNQLVGLLKDQGIRIARRTVAKYRELLAIPPSNQRKQLK